jgi:hypothetical protein
MLRTSPSCFLHWRRTRFLTRYGPWLIVFPWKTPTAWIFYQHTDLHCNNEHFCSLFSLLLNYADMVAGVRVELTFFWLWASAGTFPVTLRFGTSIQTCTAINGFGDHRSTLELYWYWLWWYDSDIRITGSKPVAFPLGYTTIYGATFQNRTEIRCLQGNCTTIVLKWHNLVRQQSERGRK